MSELTMALKFEESEKKIKWLILFVKGVAFVLAVFAAGALAFPPVFYSLIKSGSDPVELQIRANVIMEPLSALRRNFEPYRSWCNFWRDDIYNVSF